MTINAILQARAGAKCELCSAEQALTAFVVPHSPPATMITALLSVTPAVVSWNNRIPWWSTTGVA